MMATRCYTILPVLLLLLMIMMTTTTARDELSTYKFTSSSSSPMSSISRHRPTTLTMQQRNSPPPPVVKKWSFDNPPPRGGQEAAETKKDKVEPKWSWEEPDQNAPIKIAIGVCLFAIKAWSNYNKAPPPSTSATEAAAATTTTTTIPPRPPQAVVSMPPPSLAPPATATPPPLVVSKLPTVTVTGGGTASVQDLVFNLVKAIVGSGVLSLPAGIVGFGNAPSAVLPAIGLVTVMGIVSAIGFSWIAQVCALTGARSYREAWSETISPQTSWIPTLSAMSKTFLACLSYSMILSDSLRAFVVPIPSRTYTLWTLTALVLLPLCWMKDLKSLVPFSKLGVFGMIYTVCAMTFRYLHGSYQAGSPLLRQVADNLQPAFGDDGWEAIFRPQSIVFVSMLSTAYMCHFNSPKFYMELKDNTMPRFNKLVAIGFGIAIVLSALTAGIGFLTFGKNCDGFVLNNYASNDKWIALSRLAVSASLIFSYPISFQGLRDGVLDLMGIDMSKRTNALLNQVTVVLLLLVTTMATFLKDVSFVVAFGGATLGNLLVYVFPALMLGRINPRVRVPAAILGLAGIVLGIIGAILSVQKLGAH